MVSAIRTWLVCSVMLSLYALTAPYHSAMNENARFSQLANLVERRDLSSAGLEICTQDLTPGADGRLYPNKLPGPTFAAFPIASLWQVLGQQVIISSPCQAPTFAILDRYLRLAIILLLQVIPLCWSCFLIMRYLQRIGLSEAACSLFVVTFLLGNTAAILTSDFLGHTFAASCVAFLIWAILRERWGLVGVFFGILCLSDPGAPLLIPLVGFSAITQAKQLVWDRVLKIINGLLPAIVALLIYNNRVFGVFWRTIVTHQTEIFTTPGFIFGTFSPVPDLIILGRLIIGAERGLLICNTWLLIFAALIIPQMYASIRSRYPLVWRVTFLLIVSLVILLVANSLFYGWHAGETPGPRYVSLVLPACALLPALIYDCGSRLMRMITWCLVAPSILLLLLLHQGTIFVPLEPLWPFAFRHATLTGTVVRVLVVIIVAGLCFLPRRNKFPQRR